MVPGAVFTLILLALMVTAGPKPAFAQSLAQSLAQSSGPRLVVLSAQGLSLAPGDIVPADQPVTLSDGQTLSLIAASGRIVELRGPYDGPPLPASETTDRQVLDSLKGLVRQRVADTGDMGVTRLARVELPDPWVVDVNTSGPRCLRADAPVVLWRADAAANLPVSLSNRDGTWKARATWPAGEARLAAPPALAAAVGPRLVVGFPGGQADLALHTLPASLPTDAARLAWMTQVGCDDQAAALARRLP